MWQNFTISNVLQTQKHYSTQIATSLSRETGKPEVQHALPHVGNTACLEKLLLRGTNSWIITNCLFFCSYLTSRRWVPSVSVAGNTSINWISRFLWWERKSRTWGMMTTTTPSGHHCALNEYNNAFTVHIALTSVVFIVKTCSLFGIATDVAFLVTCYVSTICPFFQQADVGQCNQSPSQAYGIHSVCCVKDW